MIWILYGYLGFSLFLFIGYCNSSEDELKRVNCTSRQGLALVVFWPIILTMEAIKGLYEIITEKL